MIGQIRGQAGKGDCSSACMGFDLDETLGHSLIVRCFAPMLLLLTAPSAFPQTVPDFLLRDVNRSSVRQGAEVSPRDYRLQVSAYYFGSAG